MKRGLILPVALVALLVGCSGDRSPSTTVTTTETSTVTSTATATVTTTATPTQTPRTEGMTVRPSITSEGTPARVAVVLEGWVGQLYSPQDKGFIRDGYYRYAWISWGDGTQKDGGDTGNITCRAGGALVPLFQTVEFEHTYSAAGRYRITVSAAYCPPGMTGSAAQPQYGGLKQGVVTEVLTLNFR